MTRPLFLGLDFGTSGARAAVIDAQGAWIFEARTDFAHPRAQTPADWAQALEALLAAVPLQLRQRLEALAIDATSGTVLFADAQIAPLGPALAYFDSRAADRLPALRAAAPQAASVDALARLAWLWDDLGPSLQPRAAHTLHQADWIAAQLLGVAPATDWHNALKTGADLARADWPPAVRALPFGARLPRIVVPGSDLGAIAPEAARRFGLPPKLRVKAGTTDSNAAFLATGATRPGQAVTSLGSTITVKLLSTRRVDAPAFGVYSHRWTDGLWLVGGASNAGGAVLRQFFRDDELRRLSARVDPEADSPLDYYPLPATGERFPVADPLLAPRLSPRPADDAAFLHGLLQGLARIEAQGYARLVELGATPPAEVLTTGGGAANPVWTRLRQRLLRLLVRAADNAEAAVGAARLARGG